MNRAVKEHIFSSGQKLQIAQGDITVETVDAIVNAANCHLAHGAGVAGAIVRRGGPQVQAESNQWVHEHGPVTHANPAVTKAGNLPCRYIIHAVGPRWGDGDEAAKLKAAVHGSLRSAEQLGLESIAFPAISTGIFGSPRSLAAQVILSTVLEHLSHNPASSLKLIRLVLFDQETLQAFLKTWEQDDHLQP